MLAPAASFQVRSATPERVAAAVERTVARVTKPGAALVFCSGHVSSGLEDIARALQRQGLGVPTLIVSGLGVFSEQGELEDVSAAAGMIWAGERAALRILPATEEPTSAALLELLQERADLPLPSLLFIRSEGFSPDALWQLRRDLGESRVFGAGTRGLPGIVGLHGDRIEAGAAASFALGRPLVSQVATAHSCRLLAEPAPVTQCTGARIEQIDGEPALSVLKQQGSGLQGQPLLFTVLAHPAADLPGGYELLVRGIQGIDPDRQALLISQDVAPGTLIAFAARDAGAAREHMQAACRALEQRARGSMPRFGLFFNCSGRSRSLHGQPDVDLQILRERFPRLPLAGLLSAFEIGPFDGAPALQLYTGILSVFGSPS